MIKRDDKGRFVKGSSNPWNKGIKGYTNSGSFTPENTRGKNNLFYGRQHTEVSKQKISINNGMNSLKVREKVGKALTGKKLSQKAKEKLSIAMKKRVELGTHNFWKGGISKAYKELRHSLRNKEWRDWRTAVFQRDNYTCQICGIRSRKGKAVLLHPHHKFSVANCIKENILNLIYEVMNGTTLCIDCHHFVHRNDYQIKTNCLEMS